MNGCLASLERSMKFLCTDYIDLFFMHEVGTIDDLNKILGPNGALEGAEKAKKSGKIGNIAISMHGQRNVLIEALKQYDFAAVMTTLNYYDRFNFPAIQDKLIPLAIEKNVGVLLMKPLADGYLANSAPAAFRYALSQPVSVVVTGINNLKMLQDDLRYANKHIDMTDAEKNALFRDAPELGRYVCRQCNQCLTCPENIPIPEIFRLEGLYDRQMADGAVENVAEYALKERLRFWFGGQQEARQLYSEVSIKADKCTACGHCLS